MRVVCLALALTILPALPAPSVLPALPDLGGGVVLAAAAQKAAKPKSTQAAAEKNVYEGQAPTSAKELDSFLELLPRFRTWARENGEQAHPVLKNGKADFVYSRKAATWVSEHGWQPKRFFCVMGRMAAAMVIVEEGNDMGAARPADMPTIAQSELDLARKNLGSLLRAGGDAPASETAPAARSKKYPEPQQFAAPRYAKP